MEVGYHSPAFLEKQAQALVTMEVLWRADPDLWEAQPARAAPTRRQVRATVLGVQPGGRPTATVPQNSPG